MYVAKRLPDQSGISGDLYMDENIDKDKRPDEPGYVPPPDTKDTDDRDKYFCKLRVRKECYVDAALKKYKRRIMPIGVIFRVTGMLVIFGSVSLPYLAQTTTEANKGIISLVSLAVALLTALSSFFGLHLTWQRGIAVTAALEFYVARWEIDMLKAIREPEYDYAKEKAYQHTLYLFEQVFTTVSEESEAFFAQLRLPEQASQKAGDGKA